MSTEQKPRIFDLKKFLIPLLRRKSLYYPERNRALSLSRVERGVYKCKSCEQLFKKAEVHVDHIESVINVQTGFTTWDEYINRLFVPAEKLQVLCIACHDTKTLTENFLREINKKKRKTTKKKTCKKAKY